ncbi:LysR family transcriptional regulator [Arthrobacter silvisoli]|uniref:LysR family transcriptional regulator n=1 Tax=Arthrobacter silvisoli TaxID=2291022 RepID=UPI000E214F5E|nr:LysR family transcriptional regulator [Arthrobacter silvisoli]
MDKSPLSQLDLRHLIALAEVGRTRSFTAAARSLGYTQSAVSQQIGRLEQIVGHRLIDRSGVRVVALTPAGRILVDHAEAIHSRLESALDDLSALNRGEAGTLRVGCYESISVRILPRALRLFAERFPRVQVVLTESDDDEELLGMVETGDLDLTFVVFPMTDGPFEAVNLLDDPFVLVVSNDSPLAARTTPVSTDDLAGLPLIAYGQMRDVHQIETRLGRPQLSKQVIFRSNHNGTILSLTADGYGCAVLPLLSVDPHRPGITMLPVEKVTPRTVGVAWHKRRKQGAAASSFVEIAGQVAREIEESRSWIH